MAISCKFAHYFIFMIQRKQTLYLLIAATLTGTTYFFELWSATAKDVVFSLKPANDIVCLIAMAAATLLSFSTIFYFKNRKKQINFGFISLLIDMAFIVICLLKISSLKNNAIAAGATDAAYKLTVLLPMAALIFIVLAIFAIKKDEKLVQSLDRLR